MGVIQGQAGLSKAITLLPGDNATPPAVTVDPQVIRTPESGADFFTFAADFMKSVNQSLASLKDVMSQYRELKAGGVTTIPALPPPPAIPAGTSGSIRVMESTPPEKTQINVKDQKTMDFIEQLKGAFLNHIVNCAVKNPEMKLTEIIDSFPDPEKPLKAGTLRDMINAARMMGVKL